MEAKIIFEKGGAISIRIVAGEQSDDRTKIRKLFLKGNKEYCGVIVGGLSDGKGTKEVLINLSVK